MKAGSRSLATKVPFIAPMSIEPTTTAAIPSSTPPVSPKKTPKTMEKKTDAIPIDRSILPDTTTKNCPSATKPIGTIWREIADRLSRLRKRGLIRKKTKQQAIVTKTMLFSRKNRAAWVIRSTPGASTDRMPWRDGQCRVCRPRNPER
jgi:hypothetical protein